MWRLLRSLLFRVDAERAHHVTMTLFTIALWIPGLRALLSRLSRPPAALKVKRLGLDFSSPVGLAAGFDKDARWYRNLAALGFGSVEVGTLTAQPQPGNPRPRLFRLPLDRALLNRFGFNNGGAAAAAARIGRAPEGFVLGVNIGKSKVVPNEEAVADYVASFDRLRPVASYVAVNVSSPNTQGLRALQEKDALRSLLAALVARNRDPGKKPLLVKIAPDLSDEAIDDVVSLALELGLDGIIATNTTLSRDGLSTDRATVEALGNGGVSGAPLTRRSREVVARVYRASQGRLTIIGVGGVLSADDAWELFRAGASLVQVYSGFIYGGPGFARALNKGLVVRLAAAGKASIDDVVGEAARPEN